MPRDYHPGASGLRSLGVIEIEGVTKSDAADSDVHNRADLSSTEAQPPSEHIAVKRRTRKQSLKARESQKLQQKPNEHLSGTQRAQGDQDQDIMSLLREMNRNTVEMNKRMAETNKRMVQMEKSNVEKEEAYKGQIASLEETV
ncbi:hypothetical protein LTR66_008454 [Elasticomyces elasticus]|nr:hypothetical protein LTR66_008454 [Elasticomyces elasticus]